MLCLRIHLAFDFFFNDTATTEIYTLSLHDALPISLGDAGSRFAIRCLDENRGAGAAGGGDVLVRVEQDRKSTRLNSSHGYISYAVFCLKKKIKLAQLETSNSSLAILQIAAVHYGLS